MSVFTILTISAAVNSDIVKAINVVYESKLAFLVLSHNSILWRLYSSTVPESVSLQCKMILRR